MKVRYDEGLAIRIGPKPCVDVRKDVDEASVGDGTGQPLSHEILTSRALTLFRKRKAIQPDALSQERQATPLGFMPFAVDRV